MGDVIGQRKSRLVYLNSIGVYVFSCVPNFSSIGLIKLFFYRLGMVLMSLKLDLTNFRKLFFNAIEIVLFIHFCGDHTIGICTEYTNHPV